MTNYYSRNYNLDFSNEEEKVIKKLAVIKDNSKTGKSVNASEFDYINIENIALREENLYSQVDEEIKKLANEIWELGLLQPLIVRTNDDKNSDKEYVLSDGQRRYTALKMCVERAMQEDDEDRVEDFSNPMCRILDSFLTLNEKQVHDAANDYRFKNAIGLILRCEPKPKDEFFGTTKNPTKKREEYIKIKYGEDGINKFEKGLIQVKFNKSDMHEYVYLKNKREYTKLKLDAQSVRRYTDALIKLPKNFKRALLDEVIELTPRQLLKVASMKNAEQSRVMAKLLAGVPFENVGVKKSKATKRSKSQIEMIGEQSKKFITASKNISIKDINEDVLDDVDKDLVNAWKRIEKELDLIETILETKNWNVFQKK